jgi:hypothetical protein
MNVYCEVCGLSLDGIDRYRANGFAPKPCARCPGEVVAKLDPLRRCSCSHVAQHHEPTCSVRDCLCDRFSPMRGFHA